MGPATLICKNYLIGSCARNLTVTRNSNLSCGWAKKNPPKRALLSRKTMQCEVNSTLIRPVPRRCLRGHMVAQAHLLVVLIHKHQLGFMTSHLVFVHLRE